MQSPAIGALELLLLMSVCLRCRNISSRYLFRHSYHGLEGLPEHGGQWRHARGPRSMFKILCLRPCAELDGLENVWSSETRLMPVFDN